VRSAAGVRTAVVGRLVVTRRPPCARRRRLVLPHPGLVLDLAHGARLGAKRSAAALGAAIGGNEPEQEDHRLADEQQQHEGRRQEDDREGDGPLPGGAEGRQHDGSCEHDHLEPEAAQPGAALGVERRAAVLHLRAHRRPRWFGSGHSASVQVGDRPYHRPVSDAARFAPTAPRAPDAGWHPEPELISIRDEATSREALRAAGAATWEAALAYLYDHAFERAMGEPADHDGLRRAFFGPGGRAAPAPHDPTTLQAVLDEFSARVAPHTMSAYHPRSFGYFTPPPLVASVAGEVLAQVAQQGIDVWHAGPIGAFVEEEVLRWLADLVGYSDGSFGILTSGGVMANFIAMALVRDAHLARLLGAGDGPPRGRALEGLRVYTSDQTHFSIGRALDELGFPSDTLVVVPADEQFRLRGAPVAAAVERDRAAGLRPIAIAAVAGSTNTGSVDKVGELADVAAREGLWLHVDAAYGAAARLSPRDAARVADLEQADSVTVDPHKWLFQAYDIGGLVVRDGALLGQTFGGRKPEYYRAGHAAASAADAEDGHGAADQLNFWRLGFEGTRRWRALKLWLSWKHVGTLGFGRLVEENDDLAAHLAARIAASDDFEALPATPELSVVCFRHLPSGRPGPAPGTAASADLDAHQDRLQRALEASGDGWLTTTRLRGATYLRAGILNTQSTAADVDDLIELLRRLERDA
jgi:glutamate/tyrosine decarboxylase-like PLP-dependent enzyme